MDKKKESKVYMYTPIEVTFDHTNSNFYEALGLTENQYRDIGRRYDEMVHANPRGSRSKFIQMVMDNFNPLEAMVVMDNVAMNAKRESIPSVSLADLLGRMKKDD